MFMQTAVQAPPAPAFPLRLVAATLADLDAVVAYAREKLATQARAASAALLLGAPPAGLASQEESAVARWIAGLGALRSCDNGPAEAEIAQRPQPSARVVRMFSHFHHRGGRPPLPDEYAWRPCASMATLIDQEASGTSGLARSGVSPAAASPTPKNRSEAAPTTRTVRARDTRKKPHYRRRLLR